MKFIKKTFLLLIVFVFSFSQAQVTIGGSLKPNAGAILDLKENNNSGQNSTKGLLMPRVQLVDEHQLNPVITGTATTADKVAHKGLLLFNSSLDTSKNLCPGMYVWNGDKWSRLYGNCYSRFLIDSSSIQPIYLLQGETHTIKIVSEGKWALHLEGDTDIFVPGSVTPTQGDGGTNYIDVTFKLEVLTTNVITTPTPTRTGVLVFVSDVDGKEERINIVGEEIYWNPPVPITRQINNDPMSNDVTKATRGIAQALNFDVDGYFGSLSQLNLLNFTNSTLPFTLTTGTFEPWVHFSNGRIIDLDICNEEGTTRRQNAVTVSNGALILDLNITQEQLNLEIAQTGPIHYTAAASPITSLGVRYNTSSRRRIQTTASPTASWLIVDNTQNRDPKIGVTENTTSLTRTTNLNVSLLGDVVNKQSVPSKTIANAIEIIQDPSNDIPFDVENLESSYVMDGLEYSFVLKATGNWTASINSDTGAIQTSTISALTGTGDTTIRFKTSINSTATQNLSTVLRFTNTTGTQVKNITLTGVKMDITVPSDIVADADGYINGSAKMNFTASSNSTRPISITYPTLANATNNILDVQPTNSQSNSSQQIISITNGAMTKEVKIHQTALIFSGHNSVVLNSAGDFVSLGLNRANTRRTSSVNANNSWLSVNNATSTNPLVGATANTGNERSGSVNILLNGLIADKPTLTALNKVVNVKQEKKEVSTPDSVTYWMQYGFGTIYHEHNTTGFFSPTFQVRSVVFVVQVVINGVMTTANYVDHFPKNKNTIHFIGTKDGTNLPMFDIYGPAYLYFKDKLGNNYTIYVYPQH